MIELNGGGGDLRTATGLERLRLFTLVGIHSGWPQGT